MLGKCILWLSAVVFTAYGVACWVNPALAADYAGLAMTRGDAYAEVGAMYGGLQTGVGLFCAVGALQAGHRRSALLWLGLAIGLLACARLYSLLTGSEPVGGYTYGALAYECLTAIVAWLALFRTPVGAPSAVPGQR